MAGAAERRSLVAGLLFLGLALAIIAWTYSHQRPQGRTSAPSPEQTKDAARKNEEPATSYSERSGEPASRTSQQQAQTDHAKRAVGDQVGGKIDPHFDYGKLPSVRPDANPQARSVAEALRDKNHPERISPLVQPPPFNPTAYRANPSGFLGVIEPGRVFQTAQPGKDVPRMQALSPQLQEIKQGESVKLRVQAAPSYPVSFCTFDGGTFQETGLNCVTVQASSSGVAEATFVGSPGTTDECNVLVGSPMASGNVRYMVNVVRP